MKKQRLPGYRDFKIHGDDLREMRAAAEQKIDSPDFIIEAANLEQDINELVRQVDALVAKQEHGELNDDDRRAFELLHEEISDLRRLQEPLREIEEIPQKVRDQIEYLLTLQYRLTNDVLFDPTPEIKQ